MRYIRKLKNGEKVEKVLVYELPFNYENTSYGENVDEQELFDAGFVRYEESDLRLGAFKVQEALVYKHINDTLGGFSVLERDMNESEIIYNFGKILNIDEWKEHYIKAFNQHANDAYFNYLQKYPELEQSTFTQKANEAFKVIANENIDLTDTPFLSSLVKNDKEKRNQLARDVQNKVLYITTLESFCVKKRDAIKACNSIEELKNITLDLSDLVIG